MGNPKPLTHLFNRTRLHLALWYGGVMGALFTLAGFGTYQMVAHAHWTAMTQELEGIAGTVHDILEAKLVEPGQIPPSVPAVLPNLCVTGQPCVTSSSHRHTLNAFEQPGYYIRLITPQGMVVATAGETPPLSGAGGRYQQYTIALKNITGQPWGTMEVGRSLQEFDDHLSFLKKVMLAGLPLAMVWVGVASWYLSGLAMQPIYRSYLNMQQFTSDAAHELRTPLACMQAILESRAGEPLTQAEIQECIGAMARQNQRLIQLTERLLFIARLENNPIGRLDQDCCLHDLMTDVVESLLVLDIAQGIALSLVLPKPLLVVKGDYTQLGQLFTNLITNGLQHTPPGGQVRVTLTHTPHQAVVTVQDTGVGIAPAHQGRIFERFYQVAPDRASGGVGLGLAIAQSITQAHGGSIEVRSQLGQGSMFTVRLPLRFAPGGEKLL